MFSKLKEKLNRNENGQALVMVALLLTSLVLILAMVIDFGLAYHKKSAFQTALDSTSLAVVDSFGDINLETTTDGYLKVTYAQSSQLKDEIIQYMSANGFEVAEENISIYTKQSAYDAACENLEQDEILLLIKQKEPSVEESENITGYKYAEMLGSYSANFQFSGIFGSDAYNTVCKSTAKANLSLSGNPDALRYQILAFGGNDSSFSITGPIEDTFIKTGLNIIQGAINGLMDFCQNDTYLISALMGGSTKFTCPSCGYVGSGTEFDPDQNKTYYCPNCDTQCSVDDSNAVGCDITTSAAIMNGFVHSNGSVTIKSDTYRMRSYIDGFVEGESADESSENVIISHLPVLSLATDKENLKIETKNSNNKGIYLADLLTTPITDAQGNTIYTKTHYEKNEAFAKYYDETGLELDGSGGDSDYFQDRVYPLSQQFWYNQDVVADPGLITYVKDRIDWLQTGPQVTGYSSSDYNVKSVTRQQAGNRNDTEDANGRYDVTFTDEDYSLSTFTSNGSTIQGTNVLNTNSEGAQKINPLSILEKSALTDVDSNGDGEADKVLPNVYDTFDNSFNFKTGEVAIDKIGAKTSYSTKDIVEGKYTVSDIISTYSNLDSNTHVSNGSIDVEVDTTRTTIHEQLLTILTSDSHSIDNATDPYSRDSLREALPISDDIVTAVNTRKANADAKAATASLSALNVINSYTTPGMTKSQLEDLIADKKESTNNATYFELTDFTVKNAWDYLPANTSGYVSAGNISGSGYSNTVTLQDKRVYGTISSPYSSSFGWKTYRSIAVGANTTSYVTGNAQINTDQGKGFDIQTGATLYIGGNLTVNGGSSVYIHVADNATLVVGGNISATGEVVLGRNAKVIVGGSITVNNGATLTMGANSTLDAGTFADFSYINADVTSTLTTGTYINCTRDGATCTFGKVNCAGYVNVTADIYFNGLTTIKQYVSSGSSITINSHTAVGSYVSVKGTLTVNDAMSVVGKSNDNYSIIGGSIYCPGTIYCLEAFSYTSDSTISGTAYFGGLIGSSKQLKISSNTGLVYCEKDITIGSLYMTEASQLYCAGTINCGGEVSLVDSGKVFCKGAFSSSGRIELSLNSANDNVLTAGIYAGSVSATYTILQGSSQLFSAGDFTSTSKDASNAAVNIKDAGPNASSCPNMWVGGDMKCDYGSLLLSSYTNINCAGTIKCQAITSYNNYIKTGSIECTSSANFYYSSLCYTGSFSNTGALTVHGTSSSGFFANIIGTGNLTSSSLTVDIYSMVYVLGSINTGAVTIGQAGTDTEDFSGAVINGSLYCSKYMTASSVHTYGYINICGTELSASGNALEISGQLLLDTGPVDPVTEEKSGSKSFVDGNVVSATLRFNKMSSLFCTGDVTTTAAGTPGDESICYEGSMDSQGTVTSGTRGLLLCGGDIKSGGSIAIWSASEINNSIMYASGNISTSSTGYIWVSENSMTYASNYYLGISNVNDDTSDSTVYGILYADYNIYGSDSNTRTMNILVADTGTVSCANSSEIPITYGDGSIYLNGEQQDPSYDVKDFTKHKVRITIGRLPGSDTSSGTHITGYQHEAGNYKLSGDIYIDEGATLEVEQDFTVNGHITIYGTLICKNFYVHENYTIFDSGNYGYVNVSDGAIRASGNIIIDTEASATMGGVRPGFLTNTGSIYCGGYMEVKGAKNDYIGIENGTYGSKKSGYIYVAKYLAVKNATVNHRGEIYVGDYFRTSYSHGCNSGYYYGNGYEGSDSSAIFVQKDFVCTPSDGSATIIARKNSIIYCGASLKTDNNLISGNAWVANGNVVEDKKSSEESPQQYSFYTSGSIDADSMFNNVANKTYFVSSSDDFGIGIYKVVSATATPGIGEKRVSDVWPNYYSNTIKKPEQLVGTYVAERTMKTSENSSDYGFIYVEGTATVDNYTETKGKSVIYINGTKPNDADKSAYDCFNSDYALYSHHLFFFPYSRVYAGGNVKATSNNSSGIALNQWFNSIFFVDGNLDLNGQTKVRDGAKLVTSGWLWSANYMEVGKAADGADEAEDDYLYTYVQVGGNGDNGALTTQSGYMKVFARSSLIANGGIKAASYITLRHHGTIKADGLIRATTSSIDIGSCSTVCANGNLESIISTTKIRDKCNVYVTGDIISFSYLEIGKHEDEDYKYALKPSDNDNVEEGTMLESPDNNDGSSSTDSTVLNTNDMQCPYCGSKNIVATAAEDGEGETTYTCGYCGKDLTNNTSFFEDDAAQGSSVYVGGTLKARTSYLRLYAKTQAFVGDSVNVYSYLTLRHNAGLYVVPSAADYTGLEYNYDKTTGALKDINGNTVNGFYLNIDAASDEYGNIYYEQDGTKYYGFNIKKASDSSDSNGDSVIDRWLYQDEIYCYVDGNKFYGDSHAAEYDVNGETVTEEYTDCYYYTDDNGIVTSSGISEANSIPTSMVGSAITVDGATKIFGYTEVEGSVFVLGDLTVNSGGHLYSKGSISGYGQTTVGNGATMFADGDIKISCWLSISSLISDGSPYGFVLEHGNIYAGRDISINATCSIEGGTIMAGDDVTFDSIYSFYSYNNTYDAGTAGFDDMAKNIDLVVASQGRNACPYCSSTLVNEDYDGGSTCKCLGCGKDFKHDYGDINYDCIYYVGGGLSYAPNGNITSEGIYYNYYGNMMANNIDINAFYTNFHRLANWKTVDIQTQRTGDVYLVNSSEADGDD